MPIRRVVSHDRVEANVGRMALERGPILYCIEAVDHDGRVRDIALPDDAILTAERRDDLLGGVTVIRTEGRRKMRGESENEAHFEPVNLTAIPYYAWNHRGYGEMRVWLPRKVETADLLPKPTIASTSRASASHVWRSDSAAAMNDQREPKRSNDETIPRLTWWDHRGTSEWARYDFKRPTRVSPASRSTGSMTPVGGNAACRRAGGCCTGTATIGSRSGPRPTTPPIRIGSTRSRLTR